MSVLSRFLVLTALRWLPVGLIVPVVVLLPLDRGLSLGEIGAALSVQGLVVLLLELPTGGLADAWGRRPVLLLSSALALASYATVLAAHHAATLALAYALMGASRALDSGPLSAWFVDESGASPDQVTSGLGRAGAVVGTSIGAGALLSGALVAWLPVSHATALAVPYAAAVALVLVQVVAVLVLMHEHRAHRGSLRSSVRATVPTIVSALGLLRRSRVLAALVAVELFWGFGMVAFESFTPVRLGELLGESGDAAAVMGPVSAAAWGVSALGAALVAPFVRRWSAVSVSVTLRLVQGATVVAMGLVGGPVWLVVAFLATYAVHSAAGVVYESLLHQQAESANRATVLSLSSMAMHPGGSVGMLVLGAVAGTWSTGAAFVLAGVVTAAAAPLFLVRPRARVEPATVS